MDFSVAPFSERQVCVIHLHNTSKIVTILARESGWRGARESVGVGDAGDGTPLWGRMWDCFTIELLSVAFLQRRKCKKYGGGTVTLLEKSSWAGLESSPTEPMGGNWGRGYEGHTGDANCISFGDGV